VSGTSPLEALSMMRAIRRLVLTAVGLCVLPVGVTAQSETSRTLSRLSLEDLMSVEITSASRKEQRAAEVAAGIFVITQEDIRRSGMTTVPDVLRMAPGVDVAQVSANKWAVSVRGFNAVYADKLLVLIDGRTVYDRIFSGVLWDAQDLMLDDIDRIEVIRGPGAAMWGANAVNAVINIVTKPARETRGGLVRLDGGRPGEQAVVRYGGTAGAADYRAYAQWTDRARSLIAPGVSADDEARNVTAGFRADWATQPDAMMLDGAFTASRTDVLWVNFDPITAPDEPYSRAPTDAYSGHVLGRWTHAQSSGASLQVQSFVDIASRREPIARYDRRIADVDTQYHRAFGQRHDLVAGAGYRFMADSFAGHVGVALTPADDQASLATAFVQDEIALARKRLAVVLGTQVQYDSDAGAGLQPTARVMWKGLPRQHVWAAASRALRTPSRYERGIRVDYPPATGPGGLPLLVSVVGNPSAESETVVDVEGGYRLEASSAFSIDVTGFVARYDRLRTQETQPPVFDPGPPSTLLVMTQLGNALAATTRGLEIAGHWSPLTIWRLDGSYTAFRLTPDLAANSLDPQAGEADGSAPRAQWQVRSALSLGPRTTVNVALFHVGRLEQLQVDAYTRADVTAEWRFTRRLSAMAIGQNLLDPAHPEFAGPSTLAMTTQVPRSGSLRLRWTF
jgi:iron complex outermembrane recepter protein